MFSPSKSRQDRFGREFNQGLWMAYKGLEPNAKRAAHFALIVLGVFILTGHRVEILIGRSQDDRRESAGGAAGLELQDRSQLHGVVGAEPVHLGKRHGMGQQGRRVL